MKILYLGDIVGPLGREMIKDYLSQIKSKYSIDIVFANGENSAHGKGITRNVYEELVFEGISLITMGNHTYAKKDIFEFIDDADRLIVPLNKPNSLPGVGTRMIEVMGKKIRVTNILGQALMGNVYDNPYKAFDEILKSDTSDIHIVDFHAETTSEKIAFAYNYDGEVSAILGTHTHVQTADNRILPKGSAYISDIGMTGPYDGVIGQEVTHIIERMKTGVLGQFVLADGAGQLSGVIIEIDNLSNKVISINRLQINPDNKFKKA